MGTVTRIGPLTMLRITCLKLALGSVLTVQTADGVNVLSNGTLVPNNTPPRSNDELGTTIWNNGTVTQDLSGLPPGSKIFPMNITRGPIGDMIVHTHIFVGPKPNTTATGNDGVREGLEGEQ